MDPGERILMGVVSIGSLLLLIQGIQSGVMLGEYIDYDINERPIRFALAVMGSIFSIVICAVFAAGYSLEDLCELLKWLARHA